MLRMSLHLKDDTSWADKGHEIAWQQFEMPYDVDNAPVMNLAEMKPLKFGGKKQRIPNVLKDGVIRDPALRLFDSSGKMKIYNSSFSVTFDQNKGIITSLIYGGKTLIKDDGPRLNVERGFTDNDKWFSGGFWNAGLKDITHKVKDFSIIAIADNVIRISITNECMGTKSAGFIHTADYTIFGNGCIVVDNLITPVGATGALPRVGVQMTLPKEYEKLQWYGCGPHENYIDRKDSADIGLYKSTVTDQYEPYALPQETGNKEDVRWAALTNGWSNAGLLVVGDETFSFSALHYTARDLNDAAHLNELNPRKEVILCVDYGQMGIGNASCGPATLDEYRLKSKPYRYSFSLRPLPKASEIAKTARLKVPLVAAPLITRDGDGMVSITSTTPNAKIYFTTDGSQPGKGSRLFIRGFKLIDGGTITANAFADGSIDSPVSTVNFGMLVSRSKWEIIHVDSFEPGEGFAKHAIDDDPQTFWHTSWSGSRDKQPHEIQIDLGIKFELEGFTYLPRQGQQNGRIRDYEFYTSNDGKNWGKAAAKGKWRNTTSLQTVRFNKPVVARYIRLVSLSEITGQYYTSAAEIDIIANKRLGN